MKNCILALTIVFSLLAFSPACSAMVVSTNEFSLDLSQLNFQIDKIKTDSDTMFITLNDGTDVFLSSFDYNLSVALNYAIPNKNFYSANFLSNWVNMLKTNPEQKFTKVSKLSDRSGVAFHSKSFSGSNTSEAIFVRNNKFYSVNVFVNKNDFNSADAICHSFVLNMFPNL